MSSKNCLNGREAIQSQWPEELTPFGPRGKVLAYWRAWVVPGAGLEPARPFGQGILSPQRLPLPPPRPRGQLRFCHQRPASGLVRAMPSITQARAGEEGFAQTREKGPQIDARLSERLELNLIKRWRC